jgi:Flp pilus assembly protein TadD
LSEALAQFEKVVALDPDNADGWYNMGVALMQSGRKEEGERALQKARELNPVQYK